ncbi:hypothetical protein BC937DRAFT_90816 [Endogone sp. FLAS-F59071]|nr:hypothetical protein BC937DRAFT_90816 [Endogone sp. FLAS-F59071]|eukprot:RUS16782.1 hypothetical protein BC937DRAFT_90816 [Endogone sp. FLAS-F59071]
MSRNQSNRGRGNYPRNGARHPGNVAPSPNGTRNNSNNGERQNHRGPRFSQEQGRQIRERREVSEQISGDGTDDLIVAGDAGSREDLQRLAFIVLNGSRPFETQHYMRRFVNSCLMNLSNHHDVDTSGLLLSLSSSNGIARTTDIMLCTMSVDAGLRRSPVSFQYVVIPFIGLLTREKVCQTTMVQHANIIYTNVYVHSEQFLLKGVLRCIDELMERQSLQDFQVSFERMQQDDPTACTVKTFPHALFAVTRLVFQLLTRIMQAKFEDKFQEIVERLYKQVLRCKELPSDVAGNVYEREVLTREIERLNAMIAEAKGLTTKSDERAKAAEKAQQISRARGGTVVNVEFLERNFDPPGELSEDGPRHDNDFPEIADISIIPTQAEVTCMRPPFLPANGVPGAPHFIDAGWKRQLDIHFRLFREDMLDPLRKGISAFLRLLQGTLEKKKAVLERQGRLRNIVDENVDLNVYSNVRFRGLRLTKQQRVTVQLSFAPPKSKTMSTVGKRREFWERSKGRLMQGGLICLLWKSADASGTPFKMVFGVIVDRDLNQLSNDPECAFITIAFTDPSVYLIMLEDAELNEETQRVEHYMVESPNVFFESYRPILSALQQKSHTPANLPFGRYLAPTAVQMVPPHNREEFIIDPPLYTRTPNFVFDLSILLRGNETCSLNVTDRESRANAVRVLRQHSELDDTQSQALVDTLSREVALIQGQATRDGEDKDWCGSHAGTP